MKKLILERCKKDKISVSELKKKCRKDKIKVTGVNPVEFAIAEDLK